MSCLALSGAADAAWPDPTAGWEGQYSASSGLPTAAKPAWTNGGMVGSIDAVGDGGNPTLKMDMGASSSGGIYYGPGSGTASDRVTIDFRLNTTDAAPASDVMQFHLRVYRPLAKGGGQMWTYQFSKDTIKLEGNNDFVARFDEGWHDWRITIDAATRESKVYLDGSSEALIGHSGKRYSATKVRNRLEFGRNNEGVLGETRLSYLRWTNSEIVVPEPASLSPSGSASAGVPTVDWSPETFVVWPLRTDGPDQQAVVSLGDWFRVNAMFGRPGVRFIVNNMALCGLRTIWFRCGAGGWLIYPSQVPGAVISRYADTSYDNSAFDALEETVTFGHRLGMSVFAWFPVLEETHGSQENDRSRYVDLHADQWGRTHENLPSGLPSFAEPAYREYKLQIIRELVSRYDVDGLVLDFERNSGRLRTYDSDYHSAIVEAFRKQTGKDAFSLPTDDPQWMAFRAQYVGMVIKEASDLIRKLDRPVKLIVMFPAGEPLSAFWDAKAWEEWVDGFALAAHGEPGESWESPTAQADRWFEEASRFDKPSSLIFYCGGATDEQFAERVAKGVEAGFRSIVYFETTHLYWHKRWSVPLSLACPSEATLVGPAADLTGGGELQVLAVGDWRMTIGSSIEAAAEGKAMEPATVQLPARAGSHRLAFHVRLGRGPLAGGLAVQGKTVDGTGVEHPFRTDRTWTVEGSGLELRTIGQPGIPPFLVEGPIRAGAER